MEQALLSGLNVFGMNGYKLCQSIYCRIRKDNVDVTRIFASLTTTSKLK